MSVCLFTRVMILRKPSSEFSGMWWWDPLTRDDQSYETQTGQQQPSAAHSSNPCPTACTFTLQLQPQDTLQECATAPESEAVQCKVCWIRDLGSSFSSSTESQNWKKLSQTPSLKCFPDASLCNDSARITWGTFSKHRSLGPTPGDSSY